MNKFVFNIAAIFLLDFSFGCEIMSTKRRKKCIITNSIIISKMQCWAGTFVLLRIPAPSLKHCLAAVDAKIVCNTYFEIKKHDTQTNWVVCVPYLTWFWCNLNSLLPSNPSHPKRAARESSPNAFSGSASTSSYRIWNLSKGSGSRRCRGYM